MDAAAFKAWRTVMGYSQVQAGEALGVSSVTIENYERGVRRDTGAEVKIPLQIALACAALYHRIEPWRNGDPRAGIFG